MYVTDTGHEVIDKFSATGTYEGKLTETEYCEQKELPPCSGSKTILAPFTELRGVAVDPSGDLWVYGGANEEYAGDYIDEFSDEGSFMHWFRTRAIATNDHGLAVDSNDDVFASVGDDGQSMQKFTATGEKVEELESGLWLGLAIIPSASEQLANDLLADKGGSIVRYRPFGESLSEPLETFPGKDVPQGYEGFSGSADLAVNALATVYASERGADRVETFGYDSVPEVITEPPSGVSETGLTLHGSVNPEGEPVKECYFEYGTEAGKYMNTAECEPPAGEGAGHIGKGTAAVSVSAVVSGLEPADVRSFRRGCCQRTAVFPGMAQGLTISRPVITDEAASEVGSSTATVSAEIDAGGLGTCYRIEYGTSAPYGPPAPDGCVGPGEDERVSAELSGLQSDTEYTFRVSARNGLGDKSAEEAIAFTTFGPSTAELPDGRVDEAVSAVGSGDDTEVYVPDGMKGALDDLARHGIYTRTFRSRRARTATR